MLTKYVAICIAIIPSCIVPSDVIDWTPASLVESQAEHESNSEVEKDVLYMQSIEQVVLIIPALSRRLVTLVDDEMDASASSVGKIDNSYSNNTAQLVSVSELN